MNTEIDLDFFLENESSADYTPSTNDFARWVQSAMNYADDFEKAQISLLIVDEKRSAEFNEHYPGKSGATNTLAFPMHTDKDGLPIIGDIVMCAKLINQEAEDRGLEKDAHWAHLCIHSCLHIAGFDHYNDENANVMETIERTILNTFGIGDPYDLGDSRNEQ